MAIVDNGSIDVGKKATPRNSRKPVVKSSAVTCGAMSQQRGDSGRGNYSVPQKFLQLVGCCDSQARLEPERRPRAVAMKQ
jgi:hypothetical protein